MSDREELLALRRMAELEAKAGGAAPAAPAVPKPDFSTRRGPLEYTLDTISNIPGSAVKFGQDIAQVISHPIDTLQGVGEVGGGALRKGIRSVAPGLLEKIDPYNPIKSPEELQRAEQMAGAVGGIFKQRYGSSDAALDTFRTDPVGVAGDVASALTGAGGAAKLASKLPRMAAAAKAAEALSRAGSAVDPLQVAGRVGGKAAAIAGNKLAPVMRSDAVNVGEHLRNYFGERTNPLVEALRSNTPSVPGERLTSAKAAATQGFPELKTMEQQARSRDLAAQFQDIDAANAAARQAMLEPIAEPGRRYFDPQTGETPPSELENLRAQVTEPLYQRAMRDRVSVTPELNAVLQGPEIQGALGAGERAFGQQGANAAGAGRAVPEGYRPGTNVVPFNQFGTLEQRPFMPEAPSYPIQQLQQYRQQLDNVIDAARRQGDVPKVARLTEARQQLARQMEAQSGDFATANAIFRNYSAPINQASVAQTLSEALRRSTGAESYPAFLSAIQDAPGTIKKSDLSPRFQNLGEVMTPDQTRDIRNLTQSVQREAEFANLRAPANAPPEFLSTAEKLEQWLPPMLNKPMAITRRALVRAGSRGGEKARAILDDAMLDPNKLAELLTTLPESERSALSRALRQGYAPMRGAVPYVTPASVLTTPED